MVDLSSQIMYGIMTISTRLLVDLSSSLGWLRLNRQGDTLRRSAAMGVQVVSPRVCTYDRITYDGGMDPTSCLSDREMENMDPTVKWGPHSTLDKLDKSDCGQA